MLREDQKGPREENTNARHFVYLTEFVTTLYSSSSSTIGASHPPPPVHYHPHVQWDPHVTFEDPAAICVGPQEVQEAFRALHVALQPQSIRPPTCIDVKPKGASIWVTYALYQRYLGGWITLPSLLVVQVQLQQRSDIPQSDFVILSMQEEWNGVPLLTTFLNRLVRRGNGYLSYYVTRMLL
jgi:hypothetical protein